MLWRCAYRLLLVSQFIALSVPCTDAQTQGTASPTSTTQQSADATATPVVPGQLTARDLRLSKLYRSSSTDFDYETKHGADKRIFNVEPMPNISTTPKSKTEILTAKICSADAVFIGIPQQTRSQLTSDNSWIFSVLDVKVSRVLKAPSDSPLTGSTVEVTRSGGSVLLNGHVAEAWEAGGRLQHGRSYIFFVRYLPDTQTFWARGPYDTYRLSGNLLKVLPGLSNLSLSGTSITDVSTAVDSHSCQ